MVKKLFGVLLLFVSVLFLVGLFSSGGRTVQGDDCYTSVRNHIMMDKLGTIEYVENMPDWANGPRQRVTTSKGKFLFYIENKQVVTVMQYDETGNPRLEQYRAKK